MSLNLVPVLPTEKRVVEIKSVAAQVEPYEFVTPPEKFVADKSVETVPSAPVCDLDCIGPELGRLYIHNYWTVERNLHLARSYQH
jgi:hypothetical protein